MKELKIINEQEVLGKKFKIYGTIEEPLFLAKDVAEWIEHSSISMMLKTIDEEEKLKIRPKESLGLLTSNNEYWFLTEDGLYEVLMQSRKPIAKQFKKKIKGILKGLRKGELELRLKQQVPSYQIENPIERAKAWIKEQEEKEKLEQQNNYLQLQLDESKDYYSIKRVSLINNINWRYLNWRALKRESELQGKPIIKIFDANFGEVNTYHRTVFETLYPELKLN